MTTMLTVTTNLEIDPWNDDPTIVEAALRQGDSGNLERLGVLPNSTTQGKASVQLAIRMADGSVVLAQTTLRNFLMAARIAAACPVAEMEHL